MQTMPFIAIAILVLIVGLAVIGWESFKVAREEYKKTGKRPKGYYQGKGIAVGLPIGIPLGIAMGNIFIGLVLGVGIGIAIGAAHEKKHEKDLRPLTEREIEIRQQVVWKAALLFAGMLVLAVVVFFVR